MQIKRENPKTQKTETSFENVYDVNQSRITPEIADRIERKFEALKLQKKPKFLMKRVDTDKRSNFDYFQKMIFPLKRRNTLKEKRMKGQMVSSHSWVFKENDDVVITGGEYYKESGEIVQSFRLQNTAIVSGVNMFNDSAQTLGSIETRGVHSVEGPINANLLKHHAYSTATLKFVNHCQLEKEEICAALAKRLNICRFCTVLSVIRQNDNDSITFALRPPEKDCYNNHKGVQNFQSLQKEVLEIERDGAKETIEIKEVSIHTLETDLLDVLNIKERKKNISCGTRLICLEEGNLGRIAFAIKLFLNQMYVQFEGENSVKGPFNSFLFTEYDDGEVRAEKLKTKTTRVIRNFRNARKFDFEYLPFPEKKKAKSVIHQFLHLEERQYNNYLNTPIEEIDKIKKA